MTFETITVEENDRGIARLTLNRAEKHNAMSGKMIAELTEAAGLLADNENVRVVILQSAGTTFCAGGDLNWMRDQIGKSTEDRVKEGMKLATMLKALDDLPQPLIGKVQGNAFGGGVGMMCVCDIVIAVDEKKFALTETKLGLIPATIGPYVVRRLGEGAARRVFMNSAVFDTKKAKEIGLVSEIVSAEELEAQVAGEAEAFLNCAPRAVADAKSLCKTLARSSGDMTDFTAEKLAKRWADSESNEGISAFFEKRKAPWIVE